MNQGDAQPAARDCRKSAGHTPVVYSMNMAETDGSRLYHHMKADGLRIVPVLLDAPLGLVRAARPTPSSESCELCAW
jgi:hypothetical protein